MTSQYAAAAHTTANTTVVQPWEPGPPVRQEPYWAMELMCRVLGYPLVYLGWFLFLIASYLLMTHRPHQAVTVETADFFRFAGWLIVPGWGLLRFADCLFPFGSRMFKSR